MFMKGPRTDHCWKGYVSGGLRTVKQHNGTFKKVRECHKKGGK